MFRALIIVLSKDPNTLLTNFDRKLVYTLPLSSRQLGADTVSTHIDYPR